MAEAAKTSSESPLSPFKLQLFDDSVLRSTLRRAGSVPSPRSRPKRTRTSFHKPGPGGGGPAFDGRHYAGLPAPTFEAREWSRHFFLVSSTGIARAAGTAAAAVAISNQQSASVLHLALGWRRVPLLLLLPRLEACSSVRQFAGLACNRTSRQLRDTSRDSKPKTSKKLANFLLLHSVIRSPAASTTLHHPFFFAACVCLSPRLPVCPCSALPVENISAFWRCLSA